MIVKFLANKQGGGLGAVNYCLNDRVKQGTARILKGNENETRAIISQIPYKQKTTFGVLSFSKNETLTEKEKQEIINSFEKHLLCGMQERVNVLWVEHTDKDRLELNFIIPKIDLESGKSYNPYFDKIDRKRIDTWKEITNLRYNLEQPNAIEHAQSVTIKSKNPELWAKAKKLNDELYNKVADESIRNKSELLEYLKSQNIIIHRNRKEQISIKFSEKGESVFLKKGIYSDEFKSLRELSESIRHEQQERARNTDTETNERLSELITELERYTRQRTHTNSEKYARKQRENRANIDELRERNIEFKRANSTDENSNERNAESNKHDNAPSNREINSERNNSNLHTRRENDVEILGRTSINNNTRTCIFFEIKNKILKGFYNDRFRTELILSAKKKRERERETEFRERETEFREQRAIKLNCDFDTRFITAKQRTRTADTSQSELRERLKRKVRELRELARDKAIAERIKDIARDYQERIRKTANTIRDKFNLQFTAIKKRFRELTKQRIELKRQKDTYFYRTYNLKFDIDIGENNGYAYPIYHNKIIFGEIEVKSEYEINQNKALNKNDYLPISKFNADLLQSQSDPQERYKLAHKMNLDITQTQEQYQQMQKQQGEAMRQIAQQEIDNREKSRNIWKMR